MKKLLTLLLAAGFAFGMVACSGESSSTEATEEAAPAADEVEVLEEADSTAMAGEHEHPADEEHPAESTEE